jgi:hypothetical protein
MAMNQIFRAIEDIEDDEDDDDEEQQQQQTWRALTNEAALNWTELREQTERAAWNVTDWDETAENAPISGVVLPPNLCREVQRVLGGTAVQRAINKMDGTTKKELTQICVKWLCRRFMRMEMEELMRLAQELKKKIEVEGKDVDEKIDMDITAATLRTGNGNTEEEQKQALLGLVLLQPLERIYKLLDAEWYDREVWRADDQPQNDDYIPLDWTMFDRDAPDEKEPPGEEETMDEVWRAELVGICIVWLRRRFRRADELDEVMDMLKCTKARIDKIGSKKSWEDIEKTLRRGKGDSINEFADALEGLAQLQPLSETYKMLMEGD